MSDLYVPRPVEFTMLEAAVEVLRKIGAPSSLYVMDDTGRVMVSIPSHGKTAYGSPKTAYGSAPNVIDAFGLAMEAREKHRIEAIKPGTPDAMKEAAIKALREHGADETAIAVVAAIQTRANG